MGLYQQLLDKNDVVGWHGQQRSCTLDRISCYALFDTGLTVFYICAPWGGWRDHLKSLWVAYKMIWQTNLGPQKGNKTPCRKSAKRREY